MARRPNEPEKNPGDGKGKKRNAADHHDRLHLNVHLFSMFKLAYVFFVFIGIIQIHAKVFTLEKNLKTREKHLPAETILTEHATVK